MGKYFDKLFAWQYFEPLLFTSIGVLLLLLFIVLFLGKKDQKKRLEETKKFYLWRIFISMQWYLVAIIKHYRGEGKAHQIDFLGVANFFMGIAKDAKAGLDNLK